MLPRLFSTVYTFLCMFKRLKKRAEKPEQPLYDRQPGMSRRDLLKRLAYTAVGVAVVGPCVQRIDSIATHERWPDDDFMIIPSEGSETLANGGEEWLVFGGFGQKYSVNAAQELFSAIGQRQVVASIMYPNQGFTIEELGACIEEYVQARHMSTLNIVGVSMGLPTALMALTTLRAGAKPTSLPKINYLAAYSSPADVRDAIDGDLAQLVSDLGKYTDHMPVIPPKFIYSLLDGDGDVQRFLNIQDNAQWVQHIRDSIKQTMNDCSPELALSQIKIISAFNVEEQWQSLRNIVSPGNTKFIYCAPSGGDDTVDNTNAANKYRDALTRLSVPTTVLDTGLSGHANTVASAQVLGRLVAHQTTIH